MIKRLPRQLPQLPPNHPTCRILVVDDHPVNRTLLVRLLQRGGFTVKQAHNGLAAFTLWQKWQPQLILMDLIMPVVDGREATRLIRTAEKTSHQPPTKIIALTAESIPTFSHQAHIIGFDRIISKPIRPDIIFELIASFLDLQYIYSGTNTLDSKASE